MIKSGLLSDKEIMARIHEIYDRFRIPTNLRMHMLRVAGVGETILDFWKGLDVDKERIIAALLIHDLGNIVKFDLESANALNFLSEQDKKRLGFWQKVKKDVQERYGKDDHEATINMIKELGVNPELRDLIDSININESGKSNLVDAAIEVKICVYSDFRVGPEGVVSLKRRFEDLMERYQGGSGGPGLRRLSILCPGVESEIFSNVSLEPEQIDNAFIEPKIEKY